LRSQRRPVSIRVARTARAWDHAHPSWKPAPAGGWQLILTGYLLMDITAPTGSRPGARVILFGPTGRVLLLHASLVTRPDFWVCPGGGLKQGETWEDAARREVLEETGLSVHLDRAVWFRRHVHSDGGRDYDLFECFFVGQTMSEEVAPRQPDSYVHGHRWWSLEELRTTHAEFSPRRFTELIAQLEREIPECPFDCGV